MRLKAYLKKIGMSKAEFARRCGFSETTIYNAIQGKNIRLDIALKIVHQSNGEVRPEDLVGIKKEKDRSREKDHY